MYLFIQLYLDILRLLVNITFTNVYTYYDESVYSIGGMDLPIRLAF